MKFHYTLLYHVVLVLESMFLGWYCLGIALPYRLNEETVIAQEKLESFVEKIQPIKRVMEFVKKTFGPKEPGESGGGFPFGDLFGGLTRKLVEIALFISLH